MIKKLLLTVLFITSAGVAAETQNTTEHYV